MKKKTALLIMFFLLGALVMVHLLILTAVIPYDQVWAGRINSVEEMRAFETVSILVIVFMLIILTVKYQHLRKGKSNKVIDVLIWVFAGYFLLNAIGNLFSESKLELIVGTILTLTSAALCFVIAKKKQRIN